MTAHVSMEESPRDQMDMILKAKGLRLYFSKSSSLLIFVCFAELGFVCAQYGPLKYSCSGRSLRILIFHGLRDRQQHYCRLLLCHQDLAWM